MKKILTSLLIAGNLVLSSSSLAGNLGRDGELFLKYSYDGNKINIRSHSLIREGDNLTKIANKLEKYYGHKISPYEIAEQNDLENPDLIHPGMRLVYFDEHTSK
ncbi:LysM peptidoglycan-binding domain-containing protein [Candidatus Woesearchaeota archaeon]|jgi:hypothetical protein|nr:LysM peptidoglycan-binding domain-containing protein [Candidatus Woesearchaeota archaeon]MBT7237560.1 LysM peptidoglycan-binding domain-containing protein [Candidatus Woesearchaeota archaeon]